MKNTRQTAYFPIQGGEDLLTPPLSIAPGRTLYTKNYECDQNGRLRRIDGTERFDGRPSPSEQSYWKLNFDVGTEEIPAETTVTGSTATGITVFAGTLESGTYAGSDAAGYLILTQVTGTFVDNESLKVSGATKCVANGTAIVRGADNDTDDATWIQGAIEYARDQIEAVPGSGVIRGVWRYKGVTYAFRDNAGGTACVMHKSTTAGWAEVALGRKLAFTSGGNTEIVEGNVITGETSGAFATITRVVLTSGAWADGDAAGYFVFASQTGTFVSETLKVGASLDLATIAGDSTAITLLPGGRYEFENYNFYSQSSTLRMYGCDGVNPAFEFDGTIFCPIASGQPTDTPNHLRCHSKHLFLSFPGGSYKHSGLESPLEWTALAGAVEFGTGDEVVGMEVQPGGILAVWCRNKTIFLYGTSAVDWEEKVHAREAGAIEWTIQQLGKAIYLDDQGVTTLAAVQEFGDFKGFSISQDIAPAIKTALSSLKVRAKNQYRIFFTDNSGINFTFNGNKMVGATRVNYGVPVHCCCSVEDDGTEVLLFGSDDGFIYQLDKGTSFDGGAVESIARLPFNHLKSPANKKRFYKAVLEIEAPLGTVLEWVEDYDYGERSGGLNSVSIASSGGYWDVAKWNEFVWDGYLVGQTVAYLQGSGVNMGILIRSELTYVAPHILQGVILHYAVRGLVR